MLFMSPLYFVGRLVRERERAALLRRPRLTRHQWPKRASLLAIQTTPPPAYFCRYNSLELIVRFQVVHPFWLRFPDSAQAFGGLVVAVVVKYADNILKVHLEC
jgi:hypothetical protein